MNRLLNANFTRLFKTTVFKTCLAFSALAAGMVVIISYIDTKTNAEAYAQLGDEYMSLGGHIFSGGIYMLFILAIFVSSFTGTEFFDKTVRNKLIAGHRRGAVYLSNLIVCIAANILFHIVYIVCTLILGTLLLGKPSLSATDILLFSVCGVFAVTAVTAIVTLISMLVQNQAAYILAFITVTAMLFLAIMISTYLSLSPDTTQLKYKIFKFLYDFLPSCQLERLTAPESMERGKIGIFAAFDIAIMLAASGCGILAFRKKDLN